MSRTPTASDDDTYEYLCDLPACEVTAVYEPIEEDEYPDEPPPAWYSVLVKRHDVQSVGLVYCSHEHMLAGLDEHLPAPEDYPPPPQDGLLTNIGCGLALLAAVVVFVLGLVTAVHLLADLASSVMGRL